MFSQNWLVRSMLGLVCALLGAMPCLAVGLASTVCGQASPR